MITIKLSQYSINRPDANAKRGRGEGEGRVEEGVDFQGFKATNFKSKGRRETNEKGSGTRKIFKFLL